jgi:hypothetical protein
MRSVVSNASYLRYLCLLAYSGVQHVLFTLFVFFAYSGVQHVLFTLFVFMMGNTIRQQTQITYIRHVGHHYSPASTNNVNKTCCAPLYASKHK